MSRFLGGSPGSVLIKLTLLSMLVGAVMYWAGLDPRSLFAGLAGAVRALIGSGYEAIGTLLTFLAYGAAIVVPLWLLSRLFASRR